MSSGVKKLIQKTGLLFFMAAIVGVLTLQSAFAADYLVGSQDVLKISVYEHPDLATITRVSEDGNISFPLLGEVEVKNLSVQQVEKRIAEKLSAGSYISNPQVTVFIDQYRGQRVTVTGEVMKPGQYEITGPTTVLDAVSMALGMTKDAGYTILVIRKESAAKGGMQYKKISIDVDRLFKDGDFNENIQLKDKDVVHVPRADFFYVYGEVNRPGVYRIEKDITVKKAIAIAGGFTPKASKGQVEITKKQGGRYITQDEALDEAVAVDDVIMIKERLF